MKIFYIIECAIRETLRRNNRSFFNVLSYVLAVTAIIILVSIISFSNEARGQILKSTGTHFIAFIPACSSSDTSCNDLDCGDRVIDNQKEGFIMNGVPTLLFSADVVEEVKKIPEIKDAAPFLLFRLYDEKMGSYSLGGIDLFNNEAVRNNSCAETDIIDGRFLLPDDRDKVLLEQAFARSVGLATGDTISIGKKKFSICGVVNPGIRPAKADVYIPFFEAEEIIRTRMKPPLLKNEINAVLVEVRNAKFQKKAILTTEKLIPGTIVSSYSCFKPASKVMSINEYSGWFLVIMIGLGAVILAMKSQAASISERKRDIAILKLIGWSKKNITSLVITESVIHAIIGGLLGCVLSVLVLLFIPLDLLGITETGTGIPLSKLIFVIAFFLSLLGGVIAGLFPAIRATRLIPCQALIRL